MTVNGYQQNQVTHTSLENLIVLLYERAITLALQAQEEFRNQNPVLAGVKIMRARNIVSELRNGLDHEQGGDLADNLERLYTYVHDEFLRAAIEGDPLPLDAAISVLVTLKEGWKHVSNKASCEAPEDTKQPQQAPPTFIRATPQPETERSLSVRV
jgi:flagellar protein FliS